MSTGLHLHYILSTKCLQICLCICFGKGYKFHTYPLSNYFKSLALSMFYLKPLSHCGWYNLWLEALDQAHGLQLAFDICMRACDTMPNRPVPLASHRSFEMFKNSDYEALSLIHPQPPSLFQPITFTLYVCPCPSISVTFCRQIFHMVTEGTVHCLYKVVTHSRFSSTCSFDSY